MNNLDGSLICIETISITSGFLALDYVTKVENLNLIEASPVANGRFLILAQMPLSDSTETSFDFSQVREVLNTDQPDSLVDHLHIPEMNLRLLPTLFSLSQCSNLQSLIVLETESVCGLIEATHLILENPRFTPFEVKIHRAAPCGGYALFSGPEDESLKMAEFVKAKLHHDLRMAKVECIVQPSHKLKRYFEFED